MPHRTLADFLEELDHAGDLRRVAEKVAPGEKMAEIVAESARSGGSALLFGNVEGHDLPVLANALATDGRICRALGVAALEEAAEQIARLLDVSSPAGWFERFKGGSQPAALGTIAPREVKSAACQQIVRLGGDIHLDELPMLRTSDATSPRAIYSATVLSADPDSHLPIAGQFDLRPLDATRIAIGWASYDEHARLLGEYGERGRKMPAAAVIGGDPSFLLAAVAPIPPNADLCAAAGLLRGKPLDVVACRGVDLQVPAEAEIVLEGFLDPVGSGAVASPVLQVTALTHRANPIFAATFPNSLLQKGGPSHEFCTMARAMHRVFRPLVRLAMPELVDFDLPAFGGARHWATVSIRKTYAGQGHRAAHAAWGLRPLQFAKMLVVVDADVDVHDTESVLAAIAANVNPGRDVFCEQGPADPFDPAAPTDGLAHRMAIDATRK
jgi:4-hydroxy-3-polyprenylbenzoate decarboxylase